MGNGKTQFQWERERNVVYQFQHYIYMTENKNWKKKNQDREVSTQLVKNDPVVVSN